MQYCFHYLFVPSVFLVGTNSISVANFSQQQQLQAQHLSHGHGLPVPLTPHPSGLQPPAIPPIGSSAGLLALSSALGGQSHLPIKDEKKHHDNDHQRGKWSFGYQCGIIYLLGIDSRCHFWFCLWISFCQCLNKRISIRRQINC